MKILYIANFNLPDFQCDMIFHGMRSLFGPDVVDSNEAWYMYDDFRNYWNDRVPSRGMEYGRGFTLYGRFPKLEIDRTDLLSKIKNHYFDRIIYGSITRCTDFWSDVIQSYKPNEIITIDGEDDQTNRAINFNYIGRHFKRELAFPAQNTFPIDFCIPKELIVKTIPQKTQDWATVIPQNKDTYIFTEEKPYLEDYQKSYVALSRAKGGWSCLRHCEVLMNGCIPFIPNFENCPDLTMHGFPKKIILETNNKIQNEENLLTSYDEYITLLLEWTRKHLTTEEVAKSIL